MKITITVEGNGEQNVEIVRERPYMGGNRRGIAAEVLALAVADTRRAIGLDERTGQPS